MQLHFNGNNIMKDLIIKLRSTNKLSQKELADQLGISRPTLASLEKGDRAITLPELKKLSVLFDIPIEIMLDEDIEVTEKVATQNFNQKSLSKFRNLVLQCIKHGSDNDGCITKTKLAKLVYLCDFANYYKHLNPISGFEYRRLARGPVAIEFFEMIDANESIRVKDSGRAIMISLVEDPDESILDKEEKETVKAVCKKWKRASTEEIVDFTHRQIPWSMCKEREVIPYELINMEEPENVY